MMEPQLDFEEIAESIHEDYRCNNKLSGAPPWCDLAEHMKADNRAAARRIGDVLALAGLRLERKPHGEDWTQRERDQITAIIKGKLDVLAEGEHDGWVEARLREGWRPGIEKDNPTRTHHLLVPYAEFFGVIKSQLEHIKKPYNDAAVAVEVERERKKDCDSVLNYVRIIAGTAYRIVREAAPVPTQPSRLRCDRSARRTRDSGCSSPGSRLGMRQRGRKS